MKSHYVRQRGMAMVSVALSIFIMGTMGSYAMWRYVQLNQKKALDQTAVMVGERLREIDAAAKTYATEYFEQIQKLQDAKTKAGVVAVPAARVRSPELADLVSLRWLDSAHTNPVSFGGRDISFRVSYEVVGTNCSAVPTCLVKSLVVTTQPMIDSNTGDVDVGRANLAASAASKSNAGVSIPANFGGTPGNFVGVDGDFLSANSTNVAGLIGVIGGYDSQGFLAFDRRDGTLARTGSLRMKDDLGNKHDITGAKTVEVGEYLDLSTAAVAVEGTACAKTGLVSRNAEGLLLSCQSGRWKIAQGGGGTGILGTLSPLKGMMLSCTVDPHGRHTVSGGLDDNGNIQLRAGVSYCTNVLLCRQNLFGRANLRVEINQTGIIGTLTEPNSDVGNGGSDYVTKCGASFPMR